MAGLPSAIQFPVEDEEVVDCPPAVEGGLPQKVFDENGMLTEEAFDENMRLHKQCLKVITDAHDKFMEETQKFKLELLNSGVDAWIPRESIAVIPEDNGSVDGFENDGPGQAQDDGREITCECIVCDERTVGWEAAEAMKRHLEKDHGLSFKLLKTNFRMDYSMFVQFVRWMREMKKEGFVESTIKRIIKLSKGPCENLPWQHERYLYPPEEASDTGFVDIFLTLDYFAEPSSRSGHDESPIDLGNLVAEIERLQLEKKTMSEVFKRMVNERAAERRLIVKPSMKSDDKAEHNKWYFESYDDISIHHEMIFDEARTNAYLEAINDRGGHIKGSIVMDLGCGSGILSMFCANQGARKVHAIDKSKIIYDGMSNSFENNFNDVIQFHNLDLDKEDIPELKPSKVEILVSEFMGYFLFFEGMTESFIRARDKYLQHGGTMMPNRAKIELAPIGPNGLYKRKVACWDSAYGFKMPAMKNRILREPLIDLVHPNEVIGSPVEVKDLDFNTCILEDLFIAEDFYFTFNADSEFSGVVGFFSVHFDGLTKRVTLNTSPWDKPTHWKQTVFFFPKQFKVCKGQTMKVSFKSCPHVDDPRWLTIFIDVEDCQYVYELK